MPEVAAYDWVTICGEDWFVYAGLVLQAPGSDAWQLDGRLEGFAIGRSGTRQLLLFSAKAGSNGSAHRPRFRRFGSDGQPVDATGRTSTARSPA